MSEQYNQKTIEHYDKQADEFAYRNSVSMYGREYEIFFKFLPRGSSILEIGCGIGRDTKFLSERYKYTGIDGSISMLDIARKNNPDANFQVMDFYNLEFPKEAFDGFWAAASLLHVPKDKITEVLKGIGEVIKLGGVGFISLKLKDSLDEGVVKEEKRGIPTERYFSFYSEGEFDKKLNESGFDVLEVTKVKEENDERGQVWLCYFVRKQ